MDPLFDFGGAPRLPQAASPTRNSWLKEKVPGHRHGQLFSSKMVPTSNRLCHVIELQGIPRSQMRKCHRTDSLRGRLSGSGILQSGFRHGSSASQIGGIFSSETGECLVTCRHDIICISLRASAGRYPWSSWGCHRPFIFQPERKDRETVNRVQQMTKYIYLRAGKGERDPFPFFDPGY